MNLGEAIVRLDMQKWPTNMKVQIKNNAHKTHKFFNTEY